MKDSNEIQVLERGATRGATHTSAYVSIRQHTSAYVPLKVLERGATRGATHYPREDTTRGIRQHTSADVSRRQHTLRTTRVRIQLEVYVSIRQQT
jgi:hypothetical protein